MKRIVSLVLALSMVLGLCATSFAATSLTDIVDTKYQGAVEALMELDVVTGYPTGDYKPEKEVNRAELAKMIVICMGLEEDANRAQGDNIFTDVSLKDGESFAWARGYVNTAAAAGVIKGYPTGDFKPEKTVTYDEALTMMLRALGYGNVIEAEGVWPTNASLKAKELRLVKDVDYTYGTDGATRGNIAILLWNMLKTPMWKITAENQGTGMTSEMAAQMLNVKFPEYAYSEEVTLESVVVDDDIVTITVTDEDEEDFELTGELLEGDLVHLVEGMKVTTLYDREEEEFLMVYAEDELVSGVVTDVTDKRLEINGKEYKYGDDFAAEDFAKYEYVVAVVEGRTLQIVQKLPLESKLVDNLSKAQRAIGEDAIVVIEGEWATAEELEEGDLYTEVDIHGDSFYVVSRTRVEGTFEALTREEDEDGSRLFAEIDGKEYDAIPDLFEAYEEEDNDEQVDLDDLLNKDKDENKYLDKEVELLLNYLDVPVYLHFGEVEDIDAVGNFYALVSNGPWAESTSKGKVWHVELAGMDESEDSYEMTSKAAKSEEMSAFGSFDELEDEYYNYLAEEQNAALFFWAKQNDEGVIKEMKEIVDGEEFGDYTVASFSSELDDDNYLEGEWKVTNSTVVFKATPVLDDEDDVIDVKVEVLKGTDALEGVEEGLLAYETEGNTSRAAFVFVSEDAESTDLHFGKVTKYSKRAGVESLTIDGEKFDLEDKEDGEYKHSDNVMAYVGEEPDFKLLEGMLVAYTVNESGIVLKAVLQPSDLDNGAAALVEKVEDEFITTDLEGRIDVLLKDVKEEYEKATFVRASVDVDNDTNEVVFADEVETLGKGINADYFKKHDRVCVYVNEDDEIEIVVLVNGLRNDETVVDGYLVEEVEDEEPTDDPEVDPEDPEVDPEDPVVDPEDPTVDPEDPTVDPEDPEVDPEDPVVDPEDPEVDPEDPVVDPEDPVVDPEDPEVDPEDPVVDPEDPAQGGN